MKKILFVLMMCVSVLCLALGLSACKEQIDTPQTDLPQDGYSENGLKFVLNSGGDNYTVLGGRFDGEHLIVPSTFNNVPVTSVGESAFKGNNRLQFIEIPNSITSIEKQAFEDCSELEAINVDLQNPNYSSQDGILYNKERTEFIHIPKAIKGTITISENVISIGDSAFYKCNNLQGVSFGNNSKLTSIGEYAFEQCGRLQSITIPKSVTWIGDYAFCKCDSLQNIEIPEGVISVGDHAFKNCSRLTSIIIPDSVSLIGSSVFEGTAYENNEDNWTGQVLYIGNHLIEARIAISGEYSIRQGTKTIAGDAFYDCVGLTSVTIPNGVTLIGRYAFKGCNGLQDIEIPCSVASIESAAFRGCSSLQSVLFEDNSGLTEIGEGAFKDSGLRNITIPDGVISIGRWAFEDCKSLTSVTIGSELTSVGEYAFSGCTALEKAHFAHADGWYANDGSGIMEPISGLSDPALAADYLSDTYRRCYWTCED